MMRGKQASQRSNVSEFMGTRNRYPKNVKSREHMQTTSTRPTTHATEESKKQSSIVVGDYRVANHDSNVSLPEIRRSDSKKENAVSDFKENLNMINFNTKKLQERSADIANKRSSMIKINRKS
jgi:ABC-type sulfate/molybdate transport systems ATPase subunit